MKHLKLFESHSSYNGKDLIIVDIQKEYEDGFSFEIYEFTSFLNDNHDLFNSITVLYNGAETLGMISESEYKWWLIENSLDEEVLDSINFYDKGYAFFRYCMDNSIDDSLTVNLIRYMFENDINDSREIDEEVWNDLINHYKDMDVDMSFLLHTLLSPFHHSMDQ